MNIEFTNKELDLMTVCIRFAQEKVSAVKPDMDPITRMSADVVMREYQQLLVKLEAIPRDKYNAS